MAELIKVSCGMADATGFPAFSGCEAHEFACLLEALPARERKQFPPDLDSLIKTVASGIEAAESF
jgi:hypothetical protein